MEQHGLPLLGIDDLEALARILRRHGYVVTHEDDSRPRPTDTAAISGLTVRQVQVLGAVWQHGSLKEAAHELGISVTTLRTHLDTICTRLGVEGSKAAVRTAVQQGLISKSGQLR
jgi:ATP/maltotriose-dependent transcriptional regulator MalT